MRTGYVILNYETWWETLECVKSILHVYDGDLRDDGIVIVDNGSTNDSVERLKQEYQDAENIFLIENKINLGFAKGNNVGFQYCKYEMNCDFIVMMNSDIIIQDPQFRQKMIDAYGSGQFAVAGPNVINPDGTKLNPVYSGLITRKDIEKRIEESRRRILLCKLGLDPLASATQRIRNMAFGKRNKQGNAETGEQFEIDLQNGVQLQGCFFIFSPIYVKAFDGLYERTFLYGEETLLRLRCKRAGMKMAYLDQITVLHKESRTVKHIKGSLTEKHLRRFQYTLEAMQIIHDYMENENLI